MFRKKQKLTCPYCGREVKEEWAFCPYCGSPLREISPFDAFEKLIEKEFEKFDKMFGIGFPRLKLTPGFSGISITVTSTGAKPKVEVKTYGDFKKLEPEIKKRIGVEQGVKEIAVEEAPPKVTEEPEAKVKHLGLKDVVEIDLPGVKSLEDIQIKELEQSIEVKARAGDKLYFKLLPISPGRSLRKKFSDGKLVLEIER